MPEYIERDKVLSKEEFFGEHDTWDNPMADGCMAVRSDFIINLPAADVAPVRHGRWEKTDEQPYFRKHFHTVVCSVCHRAGRQAWSYCPNCGAKMNLEGE